MFWIGFGCFMAGYALGFFTAALLNMAKGN